MKEIANELIGQFAANLSKLIADAPHISASVLAGSDSAAASLPASATPIGSLQTETAPLSAFRLLFVAIARMVRRRLVRTVSRDSRKLDTK